MTLKIRRPAGGVVSLWKLQGKWVLVVRTALVLIVLFVVAVSITLQKDIALGMGCEVTILSKEPPTAIEKAFCAPGVKTIDQLTVYEGRTDSHGNIVILFVSITSRLGTIRGAVFQIGPFGRSEYFKKTYKKFLDEDEIRLLDGQLKRFTDLSMTTAGENDKVVKMLSYYARDLFSFTSKVGSMGTMTISVTSGAYVDPDELINLDLNNTQGLVNSVHSMARSLPVKNVGTKK